MHPHVDNELIILSESLVTLDTLKRPFFRVFLLVVYGRSLFRKSLVTMVTLITFIYWMSLWVSFQMNFLKEILITLITLILPLSCVFSHMNFYLNIINESLIALTTMKCFFFSPVCILIWACSLLSSEKALSHWSHWYTFFSLVCVIKLFTIGLWGI